MDDRNLKAENHTEGMRAPLHRRDCLAMGIGLAAAGVGTSGSARAQGDVFIPQATPVFDITAQIGPAQELGRVHGGRRRVIPILGGTVQGPKFNGIVLPGGADWQTIRDDGVTLIRAQYTMQADDGAIIGIINTGVRRTSEEVAQKMAAGEYVPPSEYYFRTTPVFEVGPGPHYWMTDRIFVCVGERNPDDVLIRYYEIS